MSRSEDFTRAFVRLSMPERIEFVKGLLDYFVHGTKEESDAQDLRNSGRKMGRLTLTRHGKDPRFNKNATIQMLRATLVKAGAKYDG